MRRVRVPRLALIQPGETRRRADVVGRRGALQANAQRVHRVRFRRTNGVVAPTASALAGGRMQKRRARRGRAEHLWMNRRAAVASVRRGRMLSPSGGPVRQARRGRVRGLKALSAPGKRTIAVGLRRVAKSAVRTLRRVRHQRSPYRLRGVMSVGPRASGRHVPLPSRVKKLRPNAWRPQMQGFGWPS